MSRTICTWKRHWMSHLSIEITHNFNDFSHTDTCLWHPAQQRWVWPKSWLLKKKKLESNFFKHKNLQNLRDFANIYIYIIFATFTPKDHKSSRVVNANWGSELENWLSSSTKKRNDQITHTCSQILCLTSKCFGSSRSLPRVHGPHCMDWSEVQKPIE